MRCYSCNQLVWFCNARHFWKPVLEGLFMAAIVGIMLGFLLKLLYNPGGM